VGDPTKQHHDWEPGIAPSGLFWTVPINPSSVSYDATTGRARYHLSNYAVPDYGNFFNAIARHPKDVKPSKVSFDVRWHGNDDPQQIRDAKFGFAGTFISGGASISFTAKNDTSPVTYRSEPTGQKVLYAGTGSERNGVFFT
jgi:hypothetical protein